MRCDGKLPHVNNWEVSDSGESSSSSEEVIDSGESSSSSEEVIDRGESSSSSEASYFSPEPVIAPYGFDSDA